MGYRSAASIAALTMLLTSCADLGFRGPATDSTLPPQDASELCTLVEPHRFAPATIEFFDLARGDPLVASDLDWITDVVKMRRCLCARRSVGADRNGQQEGCPVAYRQYGDVRLRA